MRRRTTALAAVAALALAGCGGVPDGAIEAQGLTADTASDPVEPIGPGSTIMVEAFEYGFELEGQAVDGPVTVDLNNIGGAEHNFRIDAAAGDNKKVEAAAGEEVEGVLKLFGPGTYTYYCDIGDHRAQGMEGTITVYATPEEASEAAAEADA